MKPKKKLIFKRERLWIYIKKHKDRINIHEEEQTYLKKQIMNLFKKKIIKTISLVGKKNKIIWKK